MALQSTHPVCNHAIGMVPNTDDQPGRHMLWCLEARTEGLEHCTAHEPLYHITTDDVLTALVQCQIDYDHQPVAVNQIWHGLRNKQGFTGIEKHQVSYRLQQLARAGRVKSVFRRGQQGASHFWVLIPVRTERIEQALIANG